MSSQPHDLQRLLAEAPLVRALARSLAADEAEDLVQQAYLRALAQPGPLARPRAWLSRLVRNAAIDRRRRRARRAARECAAAAPERVPSSHELLELEERRRALVAAVDALPKDLRGVVLLRYYEGLPPRRIAAELGEPVATVWSRLHEALTMLRARLDREHGGDRRAWLLPLAAFADAPRALPWREVLTGSGGGGFWTGVMAMAANGKLAVVAAAMVVAVGAWLWWPYGVGSAAPVGPGGGVPPPALAQGELPGGARAADEVQAPQRQAADVAAVVAPTTGDLVVHVQYANEPKTAAGLLVSVLRPDGDFRVAPRAITDASGSARFHGLAAGKVQLRLNRSGAGGAQAQPEIRAGETMECMLTLPERVTVTGAVVDEAGVGIGGALVEAVPAATNEFDAEVVAVTAADGSFAVRSAFSPGLYGARAAGFSASTLQGDFGDTGEHRDAPLRIVLAAAGGSVQGTVVDAAGALVAGAVVRVGEGVTDNVMSTPQGAAPLPAQVRTDADGRFLAVGMPPGPQPVQVRAPDLAPWVGNCEVQAHATVALRVVLGAGVSCRGVLRQEDGSPAVGVPVRVGRMGDFLQYFAKPAADGSFALRGLPGEFELWARSYELGKASATLRGEPGATLHADLKLSNGIALRGVTVDEDDRPLPWVHIVCRAEGTGAAWSWQFPTDRNGRFLAPDCPAERTLAVEATLKGRVPLQLTGVVPGGLGLTLKLLPDRTARARVTGRVLSPDGSLARGARIRAIRWSPQEEASGRQQDGLFALELTAGIWEVRIQVDGLPMLFAGQRELQSGSVWDLGDIQLLPGGTLVVREQGEGRPSYLIVTAAGEFRAGLYSPQPPLRSDPLLPGDYLLLVSGKDIAAMALPFAIQSGQETALAVQTEPGVRQRFEVVPPPGGQLSGSVRFEVRTDGRLAHWGSARAGQDGVVAAEVWLRPGSYEVATRDRKEVSRAVFTVGSAEAEPVRLVLR